MTPEEELERYNAERADPDRAEGTERGKAAVKEFVAALLQRRKGDSGIGSMPFIQACAFTFFKYLAELPEADPGNDPLYNCPILTVWRTKEGSIQFGGNIIADRQAKGNAVGSILADAMSVLLSPFKDLDKQLYERIREDSDP